MFPRHWLCIYFAIFLIPLQVQTGYGITLRFHSQVTVSKPLIHLGDIARITGASSETLSIYQNAAIAPSPPIGGQRILDFDTIRNRMLALGLSTGELEFTGPSRVVVENPGNTAAGHPPNRLLDHPANSQEHSRTTFQKTQAERAVLQIIRGSLAMTLNPSELALAEIQVQIPAESFHLFLNASPSEWNIAGWSNELHLTHRLVLSKTHDRQNVSSVPVTCTINMPPRVLTVKQILPIGHIIAESDLGWIHSNASNSELRMEEIIGMETQRILRPGIPIEREDLRKNPLVRSRDLVSVFARQGGIVVKRTMRALGTGGLGETVTFITLEGKDRIAARVTGYHEAEVIDAGPSPTR